MRSGWESTMKIIKGIVTEDVGFHARPASVAAAEAQKYQSDISISYSDKKASLKSMIGIMRLEIPHDGLIEITISGADEEEADQSLADLLTEKNFIKLSD